MIVERQREREPAKTPVAEVGPREPAVIKAPAPTRARELEYFKKLLKEIHNNLTFSEHVQLFIERLNSLETVAIAITLDDPDEIISEETQVLPPVVTPEQQRSITPPADKYVALREMHAWLDDIRYEFMYNRPPGSSKSDTDEWLEEWSKVLFDFAKLERKHVIYVQEILDKQPFAKLRERKGSIIDTGERLVKKQLAVWIIKKEKLRVYWKSLDEWASTIHDWAYANVKTEPLFVYDLKEVNEMFSDLPDEEFPEIFKILQKQKKGRVIKTSDKKVAFVFEF